MTLEEAKSLTETWTLSRADTISPEQVKHLNDVAPAFGILSEGGGVKIYYFNGNPKEIKKDVLPRINGRIVDPKNILSKLREANVEVSILHRRE